MEVGGEYKVVCISDGGEELNLYQLQYIHNWLMMNVLRL